MKAMADTAHAIEFPEYSAPTARRGCTGSPPKKLDYFRRRVPICLIGCMKKYLVQNSKFPEILEQEWLGMKEGGSPSPEPTERPELAEDETIINPYYSQLLQYGARLGQQQNSANMTSEDFLREGLRLVAELKAIA